MARVHPSDAYVVTEPTTEDVPTRAAPQPPSESPSSMKPVDEDLLSDTNWLDDILEHSKDVLVDSCPGIAALINCDSSDSFQQFRSLLADEGVEVYLQMGLTYFHVPHTLLAFRLRKTQKMPPCLQLRQLKSIIERSLKVAGPNELTMLWPLHNGHVVRALFALEGLAFVGKKVSLDDAASVRRSWSSCCFAIGASLGISLGSWHCYLKVVQRQYGAAVAYSIARSFFFTQKLWILAVWSTLFGLILDQIELESTQRKILSAVMQVGVLAWGVTVAFLGTKRNNILPALSGSNTGEFMDPDSLINSDYRGPAWKRSRTIVLETFVIPLTILHFVFVICTIYLMAQLLVHIVYIWGRCRDELKKDDLEDCDATYWHGINGFLATLATEIAIAVLLIIFSELTKLIAWWLTSLRNLEKLLKKQFSQEAIFIYMNIIERLIILTIICFIFTPQWVHPPANLSDVDCSTFLFGDSDMFCLQLHISLETRQGIFKNIMISAFVIEPFIEVLLKSVIPYLVMRLDRCARNVRCGCRASDCLVDGLAHLLALIFYFDCPKVGCIAYTWRGWPFRDFQTQVPDVKHHGEDDTHDSSPSVDANDSAVVDMLRQSVRREYEAIEEIKEIKLSFMCLLYFSFIYPYGVLAIVISRILECQFDLAKLLLVCRRPFPEPDLLLHWTQVSFYISAVSGALGWNIGLFMLTYNEDLPTWSYSARWGAAVTLSVWQLACMLTILRPFPKLK